MKGLRWAVAGILMTFLAAGTPKAEAQMGLAFDSELLNKNAVDFKLKTLSGPEKSMTASREGKDAILFFWATWCPHCREQLKELIANKASIEQQGIKVILVDVGEAAQEVKSYAKKYNVAFDIFLDEDSVVSEQYEVIGVPTFVFINKTGVIKGVEHALPSDLPAIYQK